MQGRVEDSHTARRRLRFRCKSSPRLALRSWPFRTALWKRLEVGGKLEFATDHKEYFDEVCEGFVRRISSKYGKI